jgi:hypothetical protein
MGKRAAVSSLQNLSWGRHYNMLDKLDQIKKFVNANESEFVLSVGVILISLISFAAGRLTAPNLDKQEITIERLAPNSAEVTPSKPGNASINSAFQNITDDSKLQELQDRSGGLYVASKNSDKYHLPSCSGAKRIAEHNKIWFNSKEEAEGLGYQPAANCPGL